MASTPPLRGAVRPMGDGGLGYCYQCIQYMARKQLRGEPLDGFQPAYAANLAPFPFPNGMIIALAACYSCQVGEGVAGQPGPGGRLSPDDLRSAAPRPRRCS